MRAFYRIFREASAEIAAYETTSEGTPISPAFPNTPAGRLALINFCAANCTTFADNRADAETWAAAPGRRLTPAEQLFLEACREAREKGEQKRRLRRYRLLVGLALLGLILGVAVLWAYSSIRDARTKLAPD